MVFVDASVIIAIIAREDDWLEHVARLEASEMAYCSPLAKWEAAVGLARERQCSLADAAALVDDFLDELEAQSISITEPIGQAALEAWDHYGRGRHPAGLNFGDCFAYACARVNGLELVYKGEDFSHTDLAG